MHVAEILSDLTSLQVCDSSAALALVNIRANNKTTDAATIGESIRQADTDLRRARDLLDLHAQVKIAHRDGLDQELQMARDSVQAALRSS